MKEKPYASHELYKIASRYRETLKNKKHLITPEDYLFESQIVIIKTAPPILVRPYQWKGEPYRSGLKVVTADGKKLLLNDLSMIEEVLITRFLDDDIQKSLLKYIFPKD